MSKSLRVLGGSPIFRITLSCVALLGMMVSPAVAQKRAPRAPALSVPPLSAKLGEPIQLFNGKDLSHWIWFQKPAKAGTMEPVAPLADVWSVKDGVLCSKGKPTGYLRTTAPFTNYVLTVEQRHLAKGEGGILVGIDAPDRFWAGIELQTATGDAGDIWNHNRLNLNADILRIKPDGKRVVRVGPDSQQPVGEWDTMEVTVDGKNLSFKVNGQLQNVATEAEGLSGTIGLLVEGAEMEFRKVEVRMIGDPFGGDGGFSAGAGAGHGAAGGKEGRGGGAF